MGADYQFWLSDDAGRRITLLDNISYFSYSRAVSGLNIIEIGFPFQPFARVYNPYFRPDWRIEAWRSPAPGIPFRNEDVFMLRKPNVYTRADGLDMLVLYGRNGIDLLKRRSVFQLPGTSYTEKTDYIDDMMKAIVREQMLYGSALDEVGAVDNSRAWPNGEFTVQADVSMGPSTTRAFAGRNVFDTLKDLRNAAIQLNQENESNLRIHFSVVPVWLAPTASAVAARQGWEFRTFAGLWGGDRTDGIEFSVENENLRLPDYSISHLDEVNAVKVLGSGRGLSQLYTTVLDSGRIEASRWNRSEKVVNATSQSSTAGMTEVGNAELGKSRPVEEIKVEFVNTPGGPHTPRSLYGVDWDLGDQVRVNVANRQLTAEINIIHVAVNEAGDENITGRNVSYESR